MNSDTISVSVTFGARHTFHLRMIGIQEESELRQKTFGMTDDQKQATEYERNVSLLADLSVKMPDGLFPARPQETPQTDAKTIYAEDYDSPRQAVCAFFAEQTVKKERIAYFAVRSFFIRLQPEESFI
jgi:phosphoglucomutase